MSEGMKQKHFVLVHGSNHGAWVWYKLKPLLEAAGNRVTVMDLTAAGRNMTAIQDVYTLYEHTKPLLDIWSTLPSDEKVILVGHSFGGLSLALASDMFPDKISVAVFLAAFMPDATHQPSYVLDEVILVGHSFGGLSLALASDMFPVKISVAVFLTAFLPDTTHQPSYVIDQLIKRIPTEVWLDTRSTPYDSSNPNSPMSMTFGPKFLTSKLYQLCPIEDQELAKVLVRPGSLFLHELSKAKPFSNEGYGHVTRAFIICEEDQIITKEFQYWMIENFHVHHVMKIKGADHMAMLSKTRELFECLLDISNLCA